MSYITEETCQMTVCTFCMVEQLNSNWSTWWHSLQCWSAARGHDPEADFQWWGSGWTSQLHHYTHKESARHPGPKGRHYCQLCASKWQSRATNQYFHPLAAIIKTRNSFMMFYVWFQDAVRSQVTTCKTVWLSRQPCQLEPINLQSANVALPPCSWQ